MSEAGKPERRFQFSLRKVLLWVLFVALTFSILSPLGVDGIGWLVVFGWFITVLVLRWSFGGRVAAVVSVVAGIVFFVRFSCLFWWYDGILWGRRPDLGILPGVVLVGGIFGSLIGFMPFVFVEMTCRTFDWLDQIGQREGS